MQIKKQSGTSNHIAIVLDALLKQAYRYWHGITRGKTTVAWNVVGKTEIYRRNLQGWDSKMGEICSIGKGRETEFEMKQAKEG